MKQTMSDSQQKIDDLLVDWESARLAGKELSAAELCKAYPELLPQVTEKIAVLKNLSWVGDPFAVVADNTTAGSNATQSTVIPDGGTNASNEKEKRRTTQPQLPASDLSVAEFVESLSDSHLLTEEQMALVDEEIRQMQQAADETPDHKTDARRLATRLVEQDLLTEYQAKVILERGDSPLLLDRYVILDSIGAGGMGIVFKALQVSLDRIVAVKVLPQHFVDSKDKVERFKREMRSVAKLSHPNVVQAYDAHESNGVYFFAMEYVPGMDLAEAVRQNGVFPPDQAIDICAQVAKGLASAHEQNIVHRDVKPSNVLLSSKGVAKVLDLGLARTRELAQGTVNNDLTRDGLAMGTMAYMSPEQAFDAHEADFHSDIYSLGCTLYFLIHGRPIFDDANAVRTIVSHREAAPPKLSKGRNDVPPKLESLYQRMVAKRPEDRPSSMAAVHNELSELLKSRTLRPGAAPPPKRRTPASKSVPLAASSASPSSPRPASTATPPSAPRSSTTAKATPATATSAPFSGPSPNSSNSLWKWIAAALAMALMLTTGLIVGSRMLWQDRTADGQPSLVTPTEDAQRHGNDPETRRIRRIAGKFLSSDANFLVVFKDGVEYEVLVLEELPPPPYQIVEAGVGVGGFDALTFAYELPDLEILHIDGTDEDGNLLGTRPDLSGLDKATQLIDLQIFGCVLTPVALEHIGSTDNIESLSFMACTLPETDLAPLTRLTALNSLDLDETNLSDQQIPTIVQIANLSYLDVSYTELTADGVANVSSMEQLTDLFLLGLPVNSATAQLSQMPKLKYLDVSTTDIDDAGLSRMMKSKSLKFLYVVDSTVTQGTLDKLRDAHPDCEIFLYDDELVDEDGF